MDKNPSSLLVEFFSLLPKGRVLDVAMGSGRNALYLAKHKFQVEGVDICDRAVQNCLEEASRIGVKIKAKIADLTSYQIRPKTYEVIICFNYLQRDLISQMKTGLKKGGTIVYETFLIDQYLRFGKPAHREYCFERNELLKFFQDFRILFYREGFITKKKAVASLVAQKEKQESV